VNICLISTGYFPENGGGIGTYIYNLSKGLVKLGHIVHIFTSTNQGVDSLEESEGIVIHRYVKRTLPLIENKFPGVCWSFQLALAIKKLHKVSPFDLIEFPNWEAPGFISQYWLDIPIAIRLHTPFFETLNLDSDSQTFGDKFTCWLEEKSCRKAQQLISSTNCHAKTIIDEYNINRGDIEILPLGIIDKVTHHEITRTNTSAFKILYVSRLENRKGTLAFLEAIPLIYEKSEYVQIDIIGADRPHAPGNIKFKDFFTRKFPELHNIVTFHGFVDDKTLSDFYQGADLFVVPSVYESFGLIYVEAMMYGLPSIATKGGGIPEVITDGVDGFLTDINNSEQISARVLQFINDSSLLATMSLSARKSFEEKYEYLIMSQKTINLYSKVISHFSD